MAVVPSLFSEQSLNKPLFLAGHGKWIPVLEKTAYRVLCLPGRHFIIACGSVHHSQEWNGRLKKRMVCGFVFVSSLSIMFLCGVSSTTLQEAYLEIYIDILRTCQSGCQDCPSKG